MQLSAELEDQMDNEDMSGTAFRDDVPLNKSSIVLRSSVRLL